MTAPAAGPAALRARPQPVCTRGSHEWACRIGGDGRPGGRDACTGALRQSMTVGGGASVGGGC